MLHQQSPPFTSAPDQRPLPRMSKHRASAEFDYMSARLRKARSHSVTEQKLPAAWLKVLAGRSNQELASPSDGGLSSPGGSGSGASSGGTRRRSVTHMRRSNDGGMSSGESDSLSGPAFGAYPPGFRDLRRPSYGQLFPGRLAMSMSSLTEISEVPSSTTAQPISRSADNLRQIEAGLHRSSAASATPSTISSRSLHDQLQQQRIRQQLVAGAGLPSANRRMSLPNGGGGVPYGIPAYPVQDMHQSPDMYGQPPQFGSLPTQYMHFPPGVYTNARPQNYPPQQHHVAVPPPISTRLPIARMSAPLSAPLQHAGPMVSYPMYVNTTGYGLPHNQPGMSTSSALPPLPAYNHGLPHQRPQFQHGFHANFPQSHSHHHHHQQQPHFYPEHHQVHGHVRPFGGEYGDGGSSVAHGHQGIDMQLPAQPQRGSVTSLPSERDTAKPLVDNSRADHEEALTTTK